MRSAAAASTMSPGNRAQLALRHAEAGRVGGVDEVAGQRHLAAAAKSEPVHGGDDRHGQRFDGARHLVTQRREGPRFGGAHARQRRDVGPGGKGPLAHAGQDDGPQRRRGGAVAEGLSQHPHGGHVDGVQGGGTIDGDDANGAGGAVGARLAVETNGASTPASGGRHFAPRSG
jgi:hypothetical protein